MHLVYLCSPNREQQLFTSIRSLYSSGTDFNQISIITVGDVPSSWKKIKDDRISFIEVNDIGKNFWMLNKLHICNIEDDNFIFIDTDTLILRSINFLNKNKSKDIIGRTTSYYTHHSWPEEEWRNYLDKYGNSNYFPYLNTGLLVFNNGVHKELFAPWHKITNELLNDNNFPFEGRSHTNQLAFSLAAASLGLTCDFFTEIEHAYGWAKDPFEDAIVYHTGSPNFIRLAVNINRQLHILDNGPHQFNKHIEITYLLAQSKKLVAKYQQKAKKIPKKVINLLVKKNFF